MKKMALLMGALALLLALAACGGTDDGTAGGFTRPYGTNDQEGMLTFFSETAAQACATTEEETQQLLQELGEDYDGYVKATDAVAAYYTALQERADELYADFLTCEVDYFKWVAGQGLEDYETWDRAMDDFYRAWDRAMEDWYDAWDYALDDVYDRCDGLIDDAPDEVPYQETSDAWTAMYRAHSAAWTDLYRSHSDAWTEMYRAYSDVWSGFYDENTDVDALLGRSGTDAEEPQDTDAQEAPSETAADPEPKETAAEPTAASATSDPDFRAAMDSYEAFFDEYVAFMKSYEESSDPTSMLADYLTLMTQYTETMQALESIDEDELSDADALYYAEVSLRISQKLLEV